MYPRHFSRILLIPLLLTLFVVLFSGCGSQQPVSADRITLEPHASGDEQCGMYGEPLEKALRVLVEGPHVKGLLGGKGGRRPAANAPVTFRVEGPDGGATFTENGRTEIAVQTDVAGIAGAKLTLGNKPGDVIVTASVETSGGEKSVEFRAVAGVKKTHRDLERPVGGTVNDVGLELYDVDGRPAEGVTVFFHVEGAHHKSTASPERVVTDASGHAVTSWKLGETTSQYFLTAEIQDNRRDVPEENRFHGRHIRFEAMAVGKKAMLINLIGGLAIFIFGMKLMSAGLQRMADRRLKAILQAMTRNRFFAIGVGALVTAVIQSSSATTVMVVGFINAGLLNLTQAIGVVFGANIGTTITAQIIAFKLNALAYPAIALGLIIASLGRKQTMRAFGESILGFGLLFLGMTIMSGILKPLRYSPEFVSWFQLFDCTPVDGMVPWRAALMCIAIGTVTTCLIQSSSATVGLVIALAGQDLLSFYTALPLVLGDNIGTTITAQFAALGANRNAKRAALAHTMFNVIGATYMYILLFIPLWKGEPLFLGFVDAITPGEVFSAAPENLPRHIANAHTVFNLFNCAVFVPLLGIMVSICTKIIPMADTHEETVLQYLDSHLLATPSLALEQALKEVTYMLRRAQKSFDDARNYFHGGPHSLEEKIIEREDVIDRLQKEITAFLVELSQRELPPEEAALIPGLVHAVNDAERIGDHALILCRLRHMRDEQNLQLTPEAQESLRELEQLMAEQFAETYRTLDEREIGDTKRLKRRQIAELTTAISEAHVARLESGVCNVEAGVTFLDYISNLELIADHLVNMTKRVRKAVRTTGQS